MSQIEIITPLHISSGEKKYILRKNNFIYDFDKLVEKISTSDIKNISCKLAKINNRTTQSDLKDMFKNQQIDENDKLYHNESCAKFASENINLFLNQKSLNKLIIPGSTIRGWLNNLFTYYYISKNETVKTYLSNCLDSLLKKETNYKKISNNLSKKIDEILGIISPLKQFVQIKDILVDCDPMIYDLKRYSFKSSNIPIGNIEAIPMNKVIETDFLNVVITEHSKYYNDVKNKIYQTLRDDESKAIKELCIKDYIYFLSNLKTILPIINKNFMIFVINKEIEFVDNQTNYSINRKALKDFYNQILEKLNNNEIVVQLGKYTNYFDKTVGFALGEKYEKYFNKIFKPGPKTSKSVIRSMNLITIEKKQLPLGFIKINL